jgi:hypothetical protein
VCGVWWCVTPKIFEEFYRTLKNSEEEDAVSGVSVCVCGVSHYRTTLLFFPILSMHSATSFTGSLDFLGGIAMHDDSLNYVGISPYP